MQVVGGVIRAGFLEAELECLKNIPGQKKPPKFQAKGKP